MPLPNHINPDHFLHLESAEVVTREDVANAWEASYKLLAEQLALLGKTGKLYLVFGLQGGGKSTWVAENATRLSSDSVILVGPLPSRRHRKRALAIAQEAGCKAIAVWVNTPLETALKQNAMRRGLARIKDEAVLHVHENLEPPSHEEGFAEIIEVKPAVAADASARSPGRSLGKTEG
ncbi:MAG TPA: AAA family ATPase, partial [Rhizobacter sp.]|nr:AAA family ATPase [Rhizobacter sp.]